MADTWTLLLTDMVDSTVLSERLGDVAMAALWARHDRVARDLLKPHRGREIDKTDGFLWTRCRRSSTSRWSDRGVPTGSTSW